MDFTATDLAILSYSRKHFENNNIFLEDNKSRFLHLAAYALKACQIARKEGLLSLEEIIPDYAMDLNPETTFLTEGLLLVVDGVCPEDIQTILLPELVSLSPDSLEAFLCCLAYHTCLYIESKKNPRILEEFFYHNIPRPLREVMKERLTLLQREFTNEYRESVLKKWEVLVPKKTEVDLSEFETKSLQYTDKEIQRIIRDISWNDLRTLLVFCKTEVKEKYSKNLSLNTRVYIAEYIDWVQESEVEEALQDVLKVLAQLELTGEIYKH